MTNARTLSVLSGMLFVAFLSPLLAEEPPFREPILLTSCGQSADVLMVKTLLARDSLQVEYVPDATVASLTTTGTIIVVVGGSSKGLGAAKISSEDELARVGSLLEAAKKSKQPVISLHIGGQSRRGPLSDPFNELGAAHATMIIVVKGGNDDGFFTKIAERTKTPLTVVNTALETGPLLHTLFRAAEPPADTGE